MTCTVYGKHQRRECASALAISNFLLFISLAILISFPKSLQILFTLVCAMINRPVATRKPKLRSHFDDLLPLSFIRILIFKDFLDNK